MAVTTLYVDSQLLKEKISQCGYKIGYLCEQMGISRQGLWKKMNGKSPFRVIEVNFLCNLLNLTDDERVKIFKPKVEE